MPIYSPLRAHTHTWQWTTHENLLLKVGTSSPIRATPLGNASTWVLDLVNILQI
jgi:hypothetical protein